MPAQAFPADGDAFFQPRPGVNMVRYDIVNSIDREGMKALRKLSHELGWEEAKASRRAGGARAESFLSQSVLDCEQDTDTQFHFMGRKFVLGDTFDFKTEPYAEDLERNYTWTREARRQADWVVVGFHDQGARRPADEEHTKIFARGSIDAGADVYVAHGARHGGVEIYNGKAIIYGQPVFYFQNEAVRYAPPDLKVRYGLRPDSTTGEFLETRAAGEGRAGGAVAGMRADAFRGSVIHSVEFGADGNVKEVRIYPLEMKMTGTRADRGRAMLADPASEGAKQLLERAAANSEPFGSRVEIENGVGIVRPK